MLKTHPNALCDTYEKKSRNCRALYTNKLEAWLEIDTAMMSKIKHGERLLIKKYLPALATALTQQPQ